MICASFRRAGRRTGAPERQILRDFRGREQLQGQFHRLAVQHQFLFGPSRLLILGTYRPVEVLLRGHPVHAVQAGGPDTSAGPAWHNL